MPRPNPTTWAPLLDRALDPSIEIGIAITVTGIDRQHFRQTLYDCRSALKDDRYNALIMFLPAGDHTDEIWICKKEVELGEGA